MKVITNNRDLVYSSLDGKSSKVSIKNFQKWANANKVSPLPITGNWDAKTADIWAKYGNNYIATKNTPLDKLASLYKTAKDSGLVDMGKQALANKMGVGNAPAVNSSVDTTVATEEKKPMSTGVKVAIGVGAALLVTVVIVLIVKSKKK